MRRNAKITGAIPIPTSNPFGTAELREPREGRQDLLATLRARIRTLAARGRTRGSRA